MKNSGVIFVAILTLGIVGLINASNRAVTDYPGAPVVAQDPAARLATIDAGQTVDASDPRSVEMQEALEVFAARSAGDSSLEHAAGVVYATQKDLGENGVHESELEVCRHLTEAVPKGVTDDLTGVGAAYAVLRETPSGNR